MNKRVELVLRVTGLAVPAYLLVYGLLVRAHLLDHSHYAGDTQFIIQMTIWSLFVIYQAVFAVRGAVDAAFRMIMFHLMAIFYISFVSGFSMSFATAWIILMLASNAFFSKLGMWLSVIILVVLGLVDSLLYQHFPGILLMNTLVVGSTIFVGFSAVLMSQILEVDHVELTRSQAEELLQRERVLTIVNNFADGVLSTDRNGIIRVYNAASLNLLDTNANLNGRHINSVVKLYDEDDKPLDMFEVLKNTKSTTVRDDVTLTVSGETLRLEITCSPIRSSYSQSKQGQTQDGYILIMRDVTKAKSLEEERDEFISVVSHELRTPITVVEGTVSNLQVMMERPDMSPQVLKESLATAHEQILFLSRMINDLSTLSRAERGVAGDVELIDVRGLADDLYNEYAPQAEKKRLHFNLEADAHLGSIKTSRLYLKELLQNFITNALKYTKEGSVTLEVSQRDGVVTFGVKDTGIGISKSDQAKIYNKFYRSEDYRTRETSGTGLGLYVAAKLASKIGTKIELDSRLNHGSTFSIRLPSAE